MGLGRLRDATGNLGVCVNDLCPRHGEISAGLGKCRACGDELAEVGGLVGVLQEQRGTSFEDEPTPRGSGSLTDSPDFLGALDSIAERIETKIQFEHGLTRRAVDQVGESVRRGNEVLASIRDHPHESTKLLMKASACGSAFALVLSITTGVHLLHPALALFVLVTSGVFWTMAVIDERQVRGDRDGELG